MRYFFHTTFTESNSDTSVLDTDGFSSKTTSFLKFILTGRLPSAIEAKHARNCYCNLFISYENVTQPRPLRKFLFPLKQTNK